MKKSLLYLSWSLLALLFLIILVPMVYAEGCDSTTNSNCVEANSYTNSKSTSTIDSTTTVKSPPPSAISPSINSSSSDTCHIPAGGSVQTQILGISGGTTIRDLNCERLKNAKVMYDMGLKISAVAIMCQDKRIHLAMANSGTPCPINGLVGDAAKAEWENNPHLVPGYVAGKKEKWDEDDKATARGAAGIGGLFLALLFLL
jgi:hypothetical protein|tara:strand:+ start:575 stop:1180 length:606 start_codon:yes stop_codon:yes gene_type:complete